MSIHREDVLHVAKLARLGLSDAEVALMTNQLDHIIEQFAILQRLDTDAVPPTAQVFVAPNTLRADETKPAPGQNAVLSNAPHRDGEYFRVRAVLEN